MPAACPVNGLARVLENSLYLFVEFVAVSDDQDACIGLVFKNPLCKQHHHDAFATALCVPDYAALIRLGMILRGFYAKVLMRSWQLFHPSVEEDEVVHQFNKPLFVA